MYSRVFSDIKSQSRSDLYTLPFNFDLRSYDLSEVLGAI